VHHAATESDHQSARPADPHRYADDTGDVRLLDRVAAV
jgi:hypothetical protein